MRDFNLKGIVKMHEEIIDRQKELRTEQMHLHMVLSAHLLAMEDGERFKISNTYFNKDTNTIRYVGGR
jgi:hypothetical protein